MVGFNWPGNVRQLENEIRRAVTLAEAGKEIGPELFSDEVRPVKNGNGALSNQDLKSCVEAFEKQRILEGLERCGGSIAKAAALLGVTRSGLYKKMARYGIERDQSGM